MKANPQHLVLCHYPHLSRAEQVIVKVALEESSCLVEGALMAHRTCPSGANLSQIPFYRSQYILCVRWSKGQSSESECGKRPSLQLQLASISQWLLHPSCTQVDTVLLVAAPSERISACPSTERAHPASRQDLVKVSSEDERGVPIVHARWLYLQHARLPQGDGMPLRYQGCSYSRRCSNNQAIATMRLGSNNSSQSSS